MVFHFVLIFNLGFCPMGTLKDGLEIIQTSEDFLLKFILQYTSTLVNLLIGLSCALFCFLLLLQCGL